MPILIALLTLLVLPLATYAHPGKTNYQGGHRCLKECAEWNLYYGEYHLHDKEGRPIRVALKKKAKKARSKAIAEPADEPVTEVTVTPISPIISRPVVTPAVPEQEPCLASLPAGLLVLLLLWLLVRRRMTLKENGLRAE